MRRNLLAFGLLLATASGQAQAATVVGGSGLLSPGYANQLESWLVNDPQLNYNGSITLTNVFNKTDVSTSFDFHAAVAGLGATITVFEAFAYDTLGVLNSFIVGGFNPQGWDSGSQWAVTPELADRTAFIFNLTTGARKDQGADYNPDWFGPGSPGGYGAYQTFNHSYYGPTWGGGHDLYTDFSLSYGYANVWSYFSDPTNLNWGEPNIVMGPSSSIGFTIGRLETFTISASDVSAVPLPAALPLFASAVAGMGLVGWRRRRVAG